MFTNVHKCLVVDEQCLFCIFCGLKSLFFSNILYIDGTIPGCEKIIVVFKTLLF